MIMPSSIKLQTHSLPPVPLPCLHPIQVSEYPVILSIENHCSVDQQRVMAQHLNHILDGKLLKSTLDGRAPVGLPSPEVSGAICCPNTVTLHVLVIVYKPKHPTLIAILFFWTTNPCLLNLTLLGCPPPNLMTTKFLQLNV